jgi:2-aminoadipate transaminase
LKKTCGDEEHEQEHEHDGETLAAASSLPKVASAVAIKNKFSIGEDMYDFTPAFANPSGSPIRELFKYQDQPGMISFAGGYPASDLFDEEGLQQAAAGAFKTASRCLQYTSTDGLPVLKAELVRLMARRSAPCTLSELLVTTGSQQGFDLLLRVLVNPGDVVLVEQPAYPATLQALRLQGATVVPVPVDSKGLDIDALRTVLEATHASGRPKMLYTVPTFSNPTGATLPRERRIELLELAAKHKLLIVEDDPYGALRFAGEPTPSILSLTADVPGSRDWVVHLASLSKISAPGLRIGWMVAPESVLRRCTIAKQTVDLCSSPWTQAIAAEYLAGGGLERHVPRIAAAYREKCDAMCEALRSAFGKSIEFTEPDGGMFVWVQCESVDASELLKEAIDNGVLFVPGRAFSSSKKAAQSLRLSYAMPDVNAIKEGIGRLKIAFDSVVSRNAYRLL